MQMQNESTAWLITSPFSAFLTMDYQECIVNTVIVNLGT